MQSNTFSSPDSKRTSTFTKTTNRRYFGSTANPEPDMKKSSILLNNTLEDQTRLLGSKSPGLSPILHNNTQFIDKTADKSLDKKEKDKGGMYSSLIVGKSDEYKKQSGLASGDKIKQLNNWADQLKKKLSPLLNQQASHKPKGDLLSKYIGSNDSKQTPHPLGLATFARIKKQEDKQDPTKDINDYSSFTNHVKAKKEGQSSSFGHLKHSQNNNNVQHSTLAQNNPTFKKHIPHHIEHKPSFTTPSSSHSSHPPQFNPHKQQPKKAIKKDDFEIGKKLGNGMFGEVFAVRHKTLGFVCAMKILKKSIIKQEEVEDQLVREIKIQFYLQHNNIINLYGFFYDSECVYLLQELCMDGHLFAMLKEKQRFHEGQGADIIKQICEGLDYIHSERIIHRDIKPENIIMHQGVAKICDFGWAVYRGAGLRSTFCGTPLYTPPELLRGEMYDQKFDIWAIGILAYQLIVGRFPFKIYSEEDLNRILTDEITFPASINVTPDAKNFIINIIRKDPRDRIMIDQILSHPFLRKGSKDKISIDFKV